MVYFAVGKFRARISLSFSFFNLIVVISLIANYWNFDPKKITNSNIFHLSKF